MRGKMKACVLLDKNKIECKEIGTPQLKAGEVLVKVKSCGICSSDFNRLYEGSAYFFPIVLGHEFSGEVVSCADDAGQFLLNKKVVVFPLLPCFICKFCKNKSYAQCVKYSYFGSRQNGAMAEYIAVPIWNIKVLPEEMSYDIASLCEPTAVAINAVNKIKDFEVRNICISGSGTIGILCGLYASSLGKDISFIVRSQEKTEFLQTMGFKNFITMNSEEAGEQDVLIECIGSNDSLNNCIKFVRSKGQVILVGNPYGDMIFDKKIYWKILRSELAIKGVWNSNYRNSDSDDWDKAINFLNTKSDLVKKLITDRFSLDDGIRAFEDLKSKDKLHIKGVFVNEE